MVSQALSNKHNHQHSDSTKVGNRPVTRHQGDKYLSPDSPSKNTPVESSRQKHQHNKPPTTDQQSLDKSDKSKLKSSKSDKLNRSVSKRT